MKNHKSPWTYYAIDYSDPASMDISIVEMYYQEAEALSVKLAERALELRREIDRRGSLRDAPDRSGGSVP